MKKSDFFLVFGFFIFLVAASIFIQYYLQQKSNECIANPLVYGAKELSEETGYEFQGSGFFLTPIGRKSPLIIFNSTSFNIKK